MAVIGATSEVSYNILKLLQIFRQKLALWVFLSVKTFTSENLSRVISVPFQVK